MDAIRHCMWYFMFWFIMEMQKGFLSTIAWNLAFFVEINFFFRVIAYELNKIIFQPCHSNQENKLQKKVVIFSETCLNWLHVAYLKKFSKLLLIHTNLVCNNWNSPSITNVIGSQHNKKANYFSFLFERLIFPLKNGNDSNFFGRINWHLTLTYLQLHPHLIAPKRSRKNVALT